jgi:glycosyltransferase involved in cell wall biosynthesis
MEPKIFSRFNTDTVDVSICLFAKYQLYQLDPGYQTLSEYFESRGLSYEFIVLVRGARPENREFFVHFQDQYPHTEGRLRVFQVPENMPKASALRSIEKFIRGEIVLTVEAGGGHISPVEIQRMLAKMGEGYDLVNGVRDWEGQPTFNKWQSGFFNWFTRKLTGTHVHDINSTIKVLKRSLLENIPLYGDFYRFMPILAEKKGYRVTDMPVTFHDGKRKTTVYGLPSYFKRFLDILNLVFLTRFTEKPLRFFGGVGMSFTVVGVLINVWLAYERLFQHEGLRNRPILLLGILMIVVGVQIISIGLIGEMILYSRSTDFKPTEIEAVV